MKLSDAETKALVHCSREDGVADEYIRAIRGSRTMRSLCEKRLVRQDRMGCTPRWVLTTEGWELLDALDGPPSTSHVPPSTSLVPSNGHANGNGTPAAITVRSAAPLTSKERKRLDACEKTITSGLETVVEVGKALAEIREARLYRERYETFEAYCAAEWDMSRSYAYRQIASAEVAASPIGDKLRKRLGGAPLTEGLLRPLTKLEPEDRAAVVEAVCRDRSAPITSKTMEAKTREYVTPPEDLERSRESRVKSREAAADKKTANAPEKTMHTPSAAETGLAGQDSVNFQAQLSAVYDLLVRVRTKYPSPSCLRALAAYLNAWADDIAEGAGT